MFRKSQEELIAEIHNEFDTAQERLLKEAVAIMESSDARMVDVSERLKKIGFANTPVAKKGSEVKDQLVNSQEQAELIQYYKFNYPFLKFLTESELNRICDKYNLVHAPVANYVKDVPEKNLREIENAQKLRDQDVINDLYHLESSYKERGQASLEATLARLGMKNGEVTIEGFKSAILQSPFLIRQGMTEYYINKGLSSNTWLYCISTYDLKLSSPLDWNYSSVNSISRQGVFIAAPPSHFNLNSLSKKSKFGYFNVFRTEIKDPIVFRYVRGGIQVLTKWGVEGEDPSLVVEKLN